MWRDAVFSVSWLISRGCVVRCAAVQVNDRTRCFARAPRTLRSFPCVCPGLLDLSSWGTWNMLPGHTRGTPGKLTQGALVGGQICSMGAVFQAMVWCRLTGPAPQRLTHPV